jgi:hypothetical protein
VIIRAAPSVVKNSEEIPLTGRGVLLYQIDPIDLLEIFVDTSTKQRGGTTVNRSFVVNTRNKQTVSNKLLRVIGIVAMTIVAYGCGSSEFGAESVSPNTGSLTGGDTVQVFGGGFRQDVGMSVYFGAVKAENVVVNSSELITVSTPPAKVEGKVNLRIVTDDGKELLLKDAFAYVNKAGGANETKEIKSFDQRKDLREE